MFMYSKWLALSLPTRQAIAKEFGIAKTGSTHVVDNRIESDGYNIKTVEDALEAHEGDWDEIVARAEGRETTTTGVLTEKAVLDVIEKVKEIEKDNPVAIVVPPKKTTRAKSARKKGK